MSANLARGLAVLAAAAVPATAQSLLQKIQSPTPQAQERLGAAVALDGDLAVIGGPRPSTSHPGRAYVYRHDGNGWITEQVLTAAGGQAGDEFGDAVDTDGQRLIIGAPDHADPAGVNGVAYVYHRSVLSPEEWTLDAQFGSPAAVTGAGFARAVAIEGEWAAVGAFADSGAEPFAGRVFVYRRTIFGWSLNQTLEASDPETFAKFGCSVDIANGRLFVGAYAADGAAQASGAVYVYRFDQPDFFTEPEWILEDRFHAPDGSFGDSFGFELQASGTRVLIGAQDATPGGRAYVFRRVLNFFPTPPSWELDAVLEVPGSENLGLGVALDGNDFTGYTALVGDFSADTHTAGTGAVHVFEQVGPSWLQVAEVVPAEANFDDQFGRAPALDGERILIGAPRGDTTQGVFAGEVYAYSRTTLPLGVDFLSLSVEKGGVQTMSLNAGAEHAGKLYWVLGSASGTSPGTPLLGADVPLNPDVYLDFTLLHPNLPPLEDTLGLLDAPDGTDTARFNLGANAPPSLVGTTWHHAYIVLNGGAIDMVSNAVPLKFLP